MRTVFDSGRPGRAALKLDPRHIAMGFALLGCVLGFAGLGGLGGIVVVAVVIWLVRVIGRDRENAAAAIAEAERIFRMVGDGAAVAIRAGDGEWTVSAAFSTLIAGDARAISDPAVALAERLGDGAAMALHGLLNHGRDFKLVSDPTDGRRLAVEGRFEAPYCLITLHDLTVAKREAEIWQTRLDTAVAVAATWQRAFEAVPALVWLRDDGGRIVSVSDAYARAVDTDAQTAVRDQRELLADANSQALAAEARRNHSVAHQTLSVVIGGERRMLDVSETPMVTGGSIGLAVDRTECDGLKAELRRHLRAHAEVLERLNTPIAVFGADTHLTFFNQAYARLWELDEGWLHSGPTHSELLEELRARRRLPEAADFQSFKRGRLELYTRMMEPIDELMHLPDGKTLRLLAAPHPLGGVILVQEDVTSRLALESAFNMLTAVEHDILDHLTQGVAVFGGDGRLKLSNPAFARLWDLPEDELGGEPHIADLVERMRAFFEAEGDEGAERGGWAVLKEEMLSATFDRAQRSGRFERSDGSVIEFATVPLPDSTVLNTYLDATDSVRLGEALQASNAALESADELKGEFISNISHHLRTPLNGIIGFAEVLTNCYFGSLNERQLEYVKGIVNAGERLLEVIDDIVDLSSVGVGVNGLERTTVGLVDIVDTVVSLTREWARGEGVRLEVSLAPELGTILGDPRRLKQALFTLVVSALRNAPREGLVLLEVERDPAWVILTVGDRHSEETVSPNSRYRHAAADGLGLTLVRNVIELHGGEVRTESVSGRLSRVSCVLPVE